MLNTTRFDKFKAFRLPMFALGLMGVFMLMALGCGGAPSNPSALVLNNARETIIYDTQSLRNDERSFNSSPYDIDTLTDDWAGDRRSLGTDLANVDSFQFVVLSGSNGYYLYTVVKGDFDFLDIEDELDEQNYEEDTYRNVDIWRKDDDAAVLYESTGIFVIGHKDAIRQVVKALDLGEGFLAHDAQMLREAMDKLDSAPVMRASVECNINELDFSYSPRGCDAVAVGISSANDDFTDAQIAMLFDRESRAEDAFDDIEDAVYESGIDADLSNISVNGEFLIFNITEYEDF